jgi:diguanylate cyclase
MIKTSQTSIVQNWNAFLRRAEPTLGALEHSYRQHFLRADKNQIMAILPFYMGAMFIFATVDYQLFGFSAVLVGLYITRILYVGATALLWYNLKRLENENHVDQHIFNWTFITLVLILIVNASRSSSFYYNVPIDVVVVLSIYMIIPNKLSFRLIPALILSIGEIGLLIFFRGGVNPAGIRSNITTFFIANLIGFVTSTRLYSYRRKQFELQEESRLARLEIERIALTDALTGIPNRRRFLEAHQQEFLRYQRNKHPFCVLYLDIDYFKKINDTFGHAAGDKMLVEFGVLLTTQIRQVDLVGRLGGEEFAVLLIETEHQAALEVAERIRTRFQNLIISNNGVEFNTTVSIGLTAVRVDDDSFETSLHRADQALYLAKNAGRNNVQLIE